MKTGWLVPIRFVLLILALIAFIPDSSPAAQVGKFTGVEGNVDVTVPGKAAKRVSVGEPVQVGDIIRTKSKSKCEVTFLDGNIVRFAENTRLRITEYLVEQNQRKEILNLYRGKVRNMVLNARHSTGFSRNLKYEIHTPTAVCGVRGTDFVSYHQNGITGATFREGAGYGYSHNQPQHIQSIAANQTMLAAGPDQPPVVRPATAMEMGQHLKDTEPAKGTEQTTSSGSATQSESESSSGTAAQPQSNVSTITDSPDGATQEAASATAPGSLSATSGTESDGSPAIGGFGGTVPDSSFNPEADTLDGAFASVPVAPPSSSLTSAPEASSSLTTDPVTDISNLVEKHAEKPVDTTAPVISVMPESAAPVDADGTHIQINLSGSDATSIRYAYRIHETGITPAGDYAVVNPSFGFDLNGYETGFFTLDIKGTDEAGNTSTVYKSFDLSRYAVSGNVGLTGFGESSFGEMTNGEVAGISGQNWGGWILNYQGAGIPIGASFRIDAGNFSEVDHTCWLSSAAGSVAGADLIGTSLFHYLSADRMGIGTGSFTGAFHTPNGVWQGSSQGIGQYTEVPVAFTSLLGGPILSLTAGAVHEIEYEKRLDSSEDFLSYRYGYFSGDNVAGGRGGQFEELENSGADDAEYEYLPNGQYVKWSRGDGLERIVEGGTTGESLNLEADPPEGNLSYFLSSFTDGACKITEKSWSSSGIVRTGAMKGIMGGAENLWTASAADIVLMGEYQSAVPIIEQDLPTGFSLSFDSWREDQPGGTTPDGGAYSGFISGRIGGAQNGLEGFLYGLYIDPDNAAGILRGSFTGSHYPEISMWEADGAIHPIWKTNGTKEHISAEDLLEAANVNLFQNYIFLDNAAGGFVGSSSSSGFLSGWYGYGGTMSIRGEDWGIYSLSFALDNKYENPHDPGAWRAGLFGSGEFGRFYQNGSASWIADAGLWLADIPSTASTWRSGRVSAYMDGEYGKFMTYTRMGILKNGQLLGSYIPDSEGSTNGIWSADSMGIWEKTADIHYSSGIDGRSYIVRHIRGGRYEYGDGSVYNYSYSDDHPVNGAQRFGHSCFEDAANNTIVQKNYTDGRVDVWTKEGISDYVYSDGGFYTEGGLAALETAPAESWVHAGSASEFIFDYDHVEGIMGGLKSDLWTTSTETGITFLGEFDTENRETAPSIFSGNIVSFDPRITLNSYENTTSPLGGAYFGTLGGCVHNRGSADSPWESSLKGSIAALYADPSHNAGILKGSLTGSACLQLNAWEAEGTWLPVPLASEISNMDATQFRDDQYGIIRTFDSYRSYCDEDMPSATTAAGGQVHLGVLRIRTSYIDHPALYVDDPNNPGGRPAWGIVQTSQGGSYDMTTTPLGNFELNFSYLPDNNMTGQMYFLSYTQNDGLFSPDKGGNFEGANAGARIDLQQGGADILALDIHGAFDPVATSTWQAVSTGAWMETGKLVDMASTVTGIAALEALNIPCIQVGSVNLEGKGNNLDVKMNNVNFYARSTGDAPQLWATKNVSGAYTAAPALNESITLNSTGGGSITASFTPVRWDSNKWGATVNGGGSLNGGYTGNVQFQGGAAGSYNGTGSGSFSGTGAGTVKAAP
ncbi:FecR domain-containing protein [Syntrophus aciditrophicus]|uniref:Hypothetical exported protein n=1 Tax=Syntrophus aciditrophicus (strain SB) TaxID=56780 RepID=Q2LX60_SYNAS|nr:FecR domain-containing protein [Syntrophus aciditrophicus]ABC78669.1 hypothetical exported protein [Syntrophus aciditrophicus SB]